MVFDCFTFNNEIEILKIRLNVHSKFADKFVIVEATKTHQGGSKPLHFEENKSLFRDFENRIIHIIVDNYPIVLRKKKLAWRYENHQRNNIAKGLSEADDEDTIIISDVDEIINPNLFQPNSAKNPVSVYQQNLFYYFLNGQCFEKENQNQPILWDGPVSMTYKGVKKIKSTNNVRSLRSSKNIKKIKNSGWHFSYIGNIDQIISKIESFAHTEINLEEFKNRNYLKECIDNGMDFIGRDMNIKFTKELSYLPEYIQSNKEKFKDLINLQLDNQIS